LKPDAAPTDLNHDGLPDQREAAHGLDPRDAADRNVQLADGTTQLEGYMNSLVP
jgi:hypothetical protein